MGLARKLGVMGGTFDPIHFGHLAIAEEARTALGLDQVLFVPAGRPWFKAEDPVTDATHRLTMVKLAVEPNTHFIASDIEVERPGRTYSIDTLTQLADEHGPDTELYLLMGVDALMEFHRWRDPKRVLEMARVVGLSRPGVGGFDLESMDEAFPGGSERIVLLDGPSIDISGVEIRRRVTAGRSIRYLVPDAVEDYIRRQGLYQPDEKEHEVG